MIDMDYAPKTESTVRLVTRVLSSMLGDDAWGTYADLKEELKTRCARLHIRYDAGVISDAIRLIDSNRPVLPPLPRATNPTHRERQPEPHERPLSREDAMKVMAAVMCRLEKAV